MHAHSPLLAAGYASEIKDKPAPQVSKFLAPWCEDFNPHAFSTAYWFLTSHAIFQPLEPMEYSRQRTVNGGDWDLERSVACDADEKSLSASPHPGGVKKGQE